MESREITGIKMLLDNQEAVEEIQKELINSSLPDIKKFKELSCIYPAVEVCWILGYCGIRGNEKPVSLAKTALAANTRDRNTFTSKYLCGNYPNTLTFATLNRQVTIRFLKLAGERWLKNWTDGSEDLDLLIKRKKTPRASLTSMEVSPNHRGTERT